MNTVVDNIFQVAIVDSHKNERHDHARISVSHHVGR